MKKQFRAVGALMLGLSLCGGLLTTVQAAPANGNPQSSNKGDKAGRGEGRRGGGMRLMQQLNLTDAQKAKLMPIMKDMREKMMALRNDSTLTPDAKRAKMKQMHEDNETKIGAILTPAQKKQLADLKAQMKAERKAEGGGRGMRGRGPQAPVPAT